MTLQNAYAKLKIEKKRRILLTKELKKLDLESIKAGIHAFDGRQVVGDNGFKLIDVAVQNEYGNSWTMPRNVRFFKNGKWWNIKKGTLINIPATRFVTRIIHGDERRMLIENLKSELHILIRYGQNGLYYSARDVIRNVGKYMVSRIRAGIDQKMFLPNAPMTIAIKGFDKRLFEKGTLYNSIKFRSKKAKVEG